MLTSFTLSARGRVRLPQVSAGVLALLLSPAAVADDTALLRQETDIMWLAIASALVFFMQAGFALLESGMSRTKNSVNVLMKNYIDLCVGTLIFWMFGYGLMFGDNPSGWLGTSDFFLSNASELDYTLLMFQTMFAATAVTIASGAMAERTRFSAYLLLAILVTGVIYPIYGSWVWGGGWLAERGFVDFAGSTVVHSIGGWCALAGIIVLGPRLGRFGADRKPIYIAGHHLPQVALGGFILWLGWFGFNGGSTTEASLAIGPINLNTHLAAAAGVVGTILVSMVLRIPLLLTNTVNGALGGLVAITAGCASMDPAYAILTGAAAGLFVIGGQWLLARLGLDDVVGAVSVHGFCGAWGTLAAGMFHAGDLYNMERIVTQLIGIGAGLAWAFPVAYILFRILDGLVGLRVPERFEMQGLDYAEHYEIAYPEFNDIQLHKGKAAHV
jgi:ammonium transporter, Amt family